MISFCPVCGKSVEVSFKFCPYCGNALPIEEDGGTQTGSTPLVSSFRGSRRALNSSSETSPKKVKWSHTATFLPFSLHSDCDSSGSDDTMSSPDRATGTWSRPLTPKGSPVSNRLSPRTLKRCRVTTSLQALPTGTELTDQNGKHWTLGALQARDDQGILYEAEPTCVVSCESRTQKWRFSLKLDSKDGRLFNEQNFFQRAAKPLQGIPQELSRRVGLGDRVLEVFYDVTKDLSVHPTCTHKPAPITLRPPTWKDRWG